MVVVSFDVYVEIIISYCGKSIFEYN